MGALLDSIGPGNREGRARLTAATDRPVKPPPAAHQGAGTRTPSRMSVPTCIVSR